jgi:deazaflavin-dependent oxidoreductase (nitroreductase family)
MLEAAMAFEKAPKGSYGVNMPGFMKPMAKVLNPVMLWQARMGKMGELSLLVLTTTGAKSGAKRQSALGYFPDGDNAWLIVASFGGSQANPGWYHNLAAHPEAEIQIGGRKIPVTATALTGAERDAAWARVVEASPRYAGYATKTDRVIPILRLTAR